MIAKIGAWIIVFATMVIKRNKKYPKVGLVPKPSDALLPRLVDILI
jgi:hypothetical protein